jgi:integrase
MKQAVVHLTFPDRESAREAIHDFLMLKQATGTAELTLIDYKWTLQYFFDHFPDAWQTPQKMRTAFLTWISEKEFSPATYNQRLIYTRAFWKWAVSEGLQPEEPNPFRDLKRRNAPGRFMDISADKVKELLTLPDRSTWAGLRDYALILFTLDTATRPGEALQLRTEHFNFSSLLVTIPACSAKTREERIIPFSPATGITLKRFAHFRPVEWENNIPFFANERGGCLTVDQWHRRLKCYRLSDGSFFKPYDLRHAACTLHLRAGMSGEVLQRLMGHKGPQMTQRYIHLTVDDLQKQQAITSPVVQFLPSGHNARRKIDD